MDPRTTSPSFLLLILTQIRPSALPDLSETSIVSLLASPADISSPSSWFRRVLSTAPSSLVLVDFMRGLDLADCTWASRLVAATSGHGSVLKVYVDLLRHTLPSRPVTLSMPASAILRSRVDSSGAGPLLSKGLGRVGICWSSPVSYHNLSQTAPSLPSPFTIRPRLLQRIGVNDSRVMVVLASA